MRLVWADECTGAAGTPPDPDGWELRETDRWQPAGELQTYTRDPANAYYDGAGHLVLTAIRGTRGGYTSARLGGRRRYRYGRFAARIRVPTGGGIWPAWWLLGPDDRIGWPSCGEIDIMEAPSSPGTRGQIHQGTHSPRAAAAAR
jgi:beta-glucanase (GH16 family)